MGRTIQNNRKAPRKTVMRKPVSWARRKEEMVEGLYGALKHRVHMQPMEEDVGALLENCGGFFSNLTLREWFETVPVEYLYGAKDDCFVDQTSRAKPLVEAIINNPELCVVQLFDGHGRFLYAFLHVYFQAIKDGMITKEHEKSIRFIFYDFVETVDQWHKLFFPTECVECIHGNVFSYMDKLTQPNSIIYLNFCGLGPNQDSIHMHCDKSLSWIGNLSQHTKALVLIDPSNVKVGDLTYEAGVSSQVMRSSLGLNKRASVPKGIHNFLKNVPKEHMPNQINLLDMLARFMASDNAFELMVSFDVSGIIRQSGQKIYRNHEYHNITYTVWHALGKNTEGVISSFDEKLTFF